jgi:hypothetical protein
VYRSHRSGIIETVRSWFGVYPYRCHECRHRYYRTGRSRREHHLKAELKPDNRPETRKRTRRRVMREAVLYGFALVAFLTVLYYIMREPAP